ncbi:MAG TPA: SDR family oxidoreductase [Thermoanaerobaculia bacterium]|nr:SDR family oxidoreductase [Thermoanaerobaculia bacterium]
MAFGPFDLTGKVALVTGGNSGIGLGFARGLAQAGADVCIWGTNESKNERARAELERYGTRVVAMRCDVGDPDAVADGFSATVEALDRVDACFANAGIGSRGTPFDEMTLEEWRTIFRVNMDGVFFTFQEAIRHLKGRGAAGSLVATSSLASIFGAPRGEHYAATKAGLNAMVRGLAVEQARHGIRVNAILPGWIDTPMTEPVTSTETFNAKVLTRIPMRRWGTGDDFSGLAVYLASDASAYHTGDSFIVDGGYACF